MQKVGNPVPIYLDASGGLLDGGKIYVGVADEDPETDPIDLFWDSDLTIPAAQPIRTIGGIAVNGVVPSSFFCAEADYSMRLRDYNDAQVFYSPSVYTNTSGFQPLNAGLTAISLLSTTSYGRALLTLADQAALVTATGIPTPLPLAGGTMTGNIVRSGAGTHIYWFDPLLTSGRAYQIDEGDPDPSSLPGDIVFTLAP
jgi:hypothetical protein